MSSRAVDSLLEVRADLRAALLGFVQAGEGDFDVLAARVVAYQAAAVPPYGRLIEARGGAVEAWRAAPLVPTELFRDIDLTGPTPAGSSGATIFRTSGTTGAGARGTRRAPDLTLYHAGMVAPFVDAVLEGETRRRPWIVLTPPVEDAPDSSLSHMVSGLAADLAEPATSAWCMTGAGLDVAAAAAALRAATGPVVVLTTSFALMNLLDARPELVVELPHGSRVMLTGGFKGRSRELSADDVTAEVERRLGLAPAAIVPEYGMTELTSQAYGRPFAAPAWLRLRVVDPVTGADQPPGVAGLVACFDLLNLDNVSAILTSDLGTLDELGRLVLHGRAPGSTPRGCSLTAEELGLLRR